MVDGANAEAVEGVDQADLLEAINRALEIADKIGESVVAIHLDMARNLCRQNLGLPVGAHDELISDSIR